MSSKRVVKLKPGDVVKGMGTVIEVRDFGNVVIVFFEGRNQKRYGANDEVEVED